MRATTDTRHLPVKLSEEELAGKAQELAESVAAEEKLREEFAAWEDTMKQAKKARMGRIAIAHDDTVNLGEIVESGLETRPVPCTWLYTASAGYLRRGDRRRSRGQRWCRRRRWATLRRGRRSSGRPRSWTRSSSPTAPC